MSRWPLGILGEECEVVGGGTPKRNVPEYFGGDVLWATPTDVTALDDLYISLTKETVTTTGLQKSSAKLLPPGSVLLTSRATIGFTAVATNPICTNQGFANFICGKNLLPEYLAYWLPTQKELMLREAGGTTFKEISKGALKKFKVPLPPLDEQKRIVDILRRLDGIRRLRKQALDTTGEVIPSLFVEMFGDPATNSKEWKVKLLGGVVSGFEGGKNLQAGNDDVSNPYRILKVSSVTSGYFRAEKAKPAPNGYKPPTRHFVRKGDLLFSRANTVDLVGATAIVEEDHCNLLLPDKIWRFVWQESSPIVPAYMLYFLQSRAVRQEMGKLATGTSDSMRNISQKRLKTLRILLPPLKLQSEFKMRVDSVLALAKQQKEHCDRSENLMRSLMSQFFS